MPSYRDADTIVKKLSQGNSYLYFLSLVVGITTGILVSVYRLGLEKIGEIRKVYFENIDISNPILLFKVWGIFILIGVIIDFIYRKYPKISGSGIPQVKALILGRIDYKNWIMELLSKFFGGLLSIGAGLSLGREGPSVQLGSYIGYGVSKTLKKDRIDRNYLVTSGASAGLSGAFGAPLAGIMFSIEELHKYINGKLLTCIFLSSIASDFVGRRFFGVNTAFDIAISFPVRVNPYYQFFLYFIFGIIIAFFGKLFTLTLIKSQDYFQDIKLPRFIKIAFVMTLSFSLCFVLPEITGGGHLLVEELAHKKEAIYILLIIFVIKLLFTTISYATGFPGGIFLPMLVLGALIGKIFGSVVDIISNTGPEFTVHFIVLGMAAYFVAVVKAPITGALLILEMTGSFNLLLAMATASISSFFMTEYLKSHPVYDILYNRMKKDDIITDEKNMEKTIIKIPVMSESLLDGKQISEIIWPEEVLVISIIRNEIEKIPKGRTVMMGGDVLVLLLPERIVHEVKEQLLKKTFTD